ncbi:hypothetical protein ACGE24_04195 [Corynebacterium kroppenstedtii]|uniref:hypothetical protein n=1 Tax=Corynebacterium sp. PCR 32 TaxID=3351342 RepID=UPI0030A48443
MRLPSSTVALSSIIVATLALTGCTHNDKNDTTPSSSTSVVPSSAIAPPSSPSAGPSPDHPAPPAEAPGHRAHTDNNDTDHNAGPKDIQRNGNKPHPQPEQRPQAPTPPTPPDQPAPAPASAPAPAPLAPPSEPHLQPWENFTVKHPVVKNSPCGPDTLRGATGQTDQGERLRCSDSDNPVWIPW